MLVKSVKLIGGMLTNADVGQMSGQQNGLKKTWKVQLGKPTWLENAMDNFWLLVCHFSGCTTRRDGRLRQSAEPRGDARGGRGLTCLEFFYQLYLGIAGNCRSCTEICRIII